MKTIKMSELKAGDIIVLTYFHDNKERIEYQLVMSVDIEGKNEFWCGNPNYFYFNLNEAYYGACSSGLDLNKKYKILTDRKEIVRFYKHIDCELAKYIADRVQERQNLNDLLMKI